MWQSCKILKLWRRWRRAQNDGRGLTPEALCVDCPELLDGLRRQILLSERARQRYVRWKEMRRLGQVFSTGELYEGGAEMLAPWQHLWRLRKNSAAKLSLGQRMISGWHALRYSEGRGAAGGSVTPFGVPQSVPHEISGTAAKLGWFGPWLRRHRLPLGTFAVILGPWFVWLAFFQAHSSPPRQALIPIASAGIVGEVRCFRGHRGAVHAVVIVDGRRLVTAGADRMVALWDIDRGEKIRDLGAHEAPVTCLALSRDGQQLLSGDGEGGVRLWQVETGAIIQEFRVQGSSMRELLFSGDGKRALSRAGDDSVCVWDIEGRKMLARHEAGAFAHQLLRKFGGKVVTGAQDKYGIIAMTPDGKRACGGLGNSADDEGAFDVWDIDQAKKSSRFRGHKAAVTCAAFAADGKFVVTGSADQTLRLWLLPERASTGENITEEILGMPTTVRPH